VLMGRVASVYPNEVHVGRAFRSVLEPFAAGAPVSRGQLAGRRGQALEANARYTVTLSWGRSFEPWIVAVQP
jgi:hypothetical protein